MHLAVHSKSWLLAAVPDVLKDGITGIILMWSIPTYDVAEDDMEHTLPQDKYHELASDADPECDAQEAVMLRQQMLVLAKTQRDMYPLEGFLGRTQPLLLAEAHLKLGQAHRLAGDLPQVIRTARTCMEQVRRSQQSNV
jgi:hypothetical protein